MTNRQLAALETKKKLLDAGKKVICAKGLVNTSVEEITEAAGAAWEELRQTILEHGRMICEEKGEYTGMREMRAHMGFYIRGFRGSSRLRGAMQHLSRYQELVELMKAFPSDDRIKD